MKKLLVKPTAQRGGKGSDLWPARVEGGTCAGVFACEIVGVSA